MKTCTVRRFGALPLLALAYVMAAWLAGCGDDPDAPMPSPTATHRPIETPSPTPTATPAPLVTPARAPTAAPTPSPTVAPLSVYSGPTPIVDGGPEFACDLKYPFFRSHAFQDRPRPRHFLHWTPDGSHLVFGFDESVWTVDAGGMELYRVVDANPGYDGDDPRTFVYGFHADPSPDGSRIAYSSCEYPFDARFGSSWDYTNNGYEIALIGMDGGGQRRLTSNDAMDHYPVWSPDGEWIAFLRAPGDASFYDVDSVGLFVMPVAGEPRVVAEATEGMRAALYPPVWSPDGSHLAFIGVDYSRGDHGELLSWSGEFLYVVRRDGSSLLRIGETASLPTWFPGGGALAFARWDDERASIHAARLGPAGVELERLWASGADGPGGPISQLSMSPDGADILFVVPDGAYLVDSGGGGLRRLASWEDWTTLKDKEPRAAGMIAAWSPDGERIALYGPLGDPMWNAVADDERIYTIARDGTDERVLVGGRDGHLHAVNRPETPVDPSACSAGTAVPDPQSNPGLVRDCEALLGSIDQLAGRALFWWDTATPITGWGGVTVGGTPPRVVRLELANLGLAGTIPPALGKLSRLRVLDLSGNPLTATTLDTFYGEIYLAPLEGPIPDELGDLTDLEVLNLESTGIIGDIPASLGRLSNLRILNLSRNYLSGIPSEIGGLSELRELRLSRNRVSSSDVPLEIGDLSRLEVLDLSVNRLTGEIPPEIGRLSSLRILNLAAVFFWSLSPELGNLSRLEVLDLRYNIDMSGSIPPEMSGLVNLESLNLAGTELSGCVPKGLPHIWVEESGLERCP